MSSSRRSRADRNRPPAARRRDTIVALATPPGPGSIAVVRVSGPDTLTVLDRAVRGAPPSRQPSHKVRLCWFTDRSGLSIDQVMLTVFRSPRSYTGEEMAEVSCHGGAAVPAMVVDRLAELGCRHAEPGEFTRRAVLAGKLTLTQAEAILDLVNARSAPALRAAIARYQGGLAGFAARLAAELGDVLAELEHDINFAEDDKPRWSRRRLASIEARLDREIELAGHNRYLSEGARVAVIGQPNVGKSSLFNRLLGSARTIESPLRNTTRDRVDAELMLGSVPVRLTDTAGLSTRSGHLLSRQAQAQTGRAIAESDLLLAVLDRSTRLQPADRIVLAAAKQRPCLVVLNKADRPARIEERFPSSISVSCRTGTGIARLRRLLARRLAPDNGLALAAGERQLEALRSCRAALARCRTAPNSETAALEIRGAIDMLSQIDIRLPNEAILDRIFARFCVGK